MGFDIIFDTLKEEYVSGIAQIEKQSFADPWSVAAFERELENSVAHYTVALHDGEVIAYGGLWHILNEGHITNIAVAPQYRRMGVGDKLVSQMLKSGRELGIDAFTLEVRVSNEKAQMLYKKHGFKYVGTRKKYYSDGEDAMIFWLEDANADPN